jgi:transporter family-2 protein
MTQPLPARGPRVVELAAALATGALLTFMVLFNGVMSAHTTPFFASLAAHGTGTVAAGLVLAVLLLRGATRRGGRAPLWAYLGGLSGAVTVMLSSVTVNSALALTGTLALGLAGQVVFGLVCDCFGLFGLARRAPGPRDLAALGLILAGAMLVIFAGAV